MLKSQAALVAISIEHEMAGNIHERLASAATLMMNLLYSTAKHVSALEHGLGSLPPLEGYPGVITSMP